MTKLFYDDPLAAAVMARDFGVKVVIHAFLDKPWIPDGDADRFKWSDNPNAILEGWIEDENADYRGVHPDSYDIFDKMPFDKKRALMDLGMWPLGFDYKEIPLTTSGWAKVDKEDYESLSAVTWGVETKGYARRRVYLGHNKYAAELMHRVVIDAPKHMQVDHINGDKSDNRKSNLRLATNSQNQMNRKPNKNTSSKYKGVTRHKRDKRWSASIGCGGEKYHLGSFDTEDEAAIAYNKAAKKFHGEYGRLNDVNQPMSEE